MGKRKTAPKDWHYSLSKIKQFGADYNLIIGERSNGKTYACLLEAIANYAESGNQTALIRRFKEDFRGKRGNDLFAPLVANGEIARATDGVWTHVYYYSSRWFFARYEDVGEGEKKRVVCEECFMYAFALIDMEHDKGTRYPLVTIVIFDEFITRRAYLPDEFILFLNCLSTIIGERSDVVIYMLGNTVNKYCPYFAEMGLKHVRRQKQGTIDLYHIGATGLKVAVEYCASSDKKSKKSNKYFAFENQKVDMITHGVWELDIYPHCPRKFTRNDIVMTYFIIFDGDILQCEIVMVDGVAFTFIHRKTSKLQNPDKDIVYSLAQDVRPNWRTNILLDNSKAGGVINAFYRNDKVFYQDNEIGEIVRNYLIQCGKVL